MVSVKTVVLFSADFVIFVCLLLLSILHSLFRLIVWPSKKSIVGHHVLITGAGHGLGRELALEFARNGANLTLWDINEKGNEDTADAARKLGVTVNAYTCDVSVQKEVIQVGEKVLKDVGPVDILVNNADVMPYKSLLSEKPEIICQTINVNLMAHLWILQIFLPKMIESGRGHIVAISSMAGLVGHEMFVPYCASKFGVRGLMEALEEEFRRSQSTCNIKLTTVYPGLMNTHNEYLNRLETKVSALMPVTKSEAAARRIIDGIQRNSSFVCIPASYEFLWKLSALAPRKLYLQCLDILSFRIPPRVCLIKEN